MTAPERQSVLPADLGAIERHVEENARAVKGTA